MWFSNTSKEKNEIWSDLTSSDQLKEIIERSHQKPQALFKHSTRCNISSMAKGRMDRGWDFENNDVDLYYLDLLKYRSVSNDIADSLQVQHESPQLIIIKHGKVVYHASHGDIDPKLLKGLL